MVTAPLLIICRLRSEDTKDFQELQKEYEAGYGVKISVFIMDMPRNCLH